MVRRYPMLYGLRPAPPILDIIHRDLHTNRHRDIYEDMHADMHTDLLAGMHTETGTYRRLHVAEVDAYGQAANKPVSLTDAHADRQTPKRSTNVLNFGFRPFDDSNSRFLNEDDRDNQQTRQRSPILSATSFLRTQVRKNNCNSSNSRHNSNNNCSNSNNINAENSNNKHNNSGNNNDKNSNSSNNTNSRHDDDHDDNVVNDDDATTSAILTPYSSSDASRIAAVAALASRRFSLQHSGTQQLRQPRHVMSPDSLSPMGGGSYGVGCRQRELLPYDDALNLRAYSVYRRLLMFDQAAAAVAAAAAAAGTEQRSAVDWQCN